MARVFLWVDGLHMVLIVGIIFFKFVGGNYRVRGLVVPLLDAFRIKCTWIEPSNSSVMLIGIQAGLLRVGYYTTCMMKKK